MYEIKNRPVGMLTPYETNDREDSLHVRKQNTITIDVNHLNISFLLCCNLHVVRNILQKNNKNKIACID